MDNLETMLHEIREEQVRQGEQIKTLFKQAEANAKLTQSVYDLASSIKLLTNQQKVTEQKVDNLAKDVETVKSRPAKRWDEVVKTVITVIVTAAITWALTRLGG